MAKSFFERLTGGIQISEDDGEMGRARPVAAKETARVKPKAPEPAAKQNVIHPAAPEEDSTLAETTEAESPEEGQLTVDIFDDGPNIVIQSTVAGVKPEDIDISLEDNVLTVRGSRRRGQEVNEDNFYYRELYWGAFSRSIILPEEVDFQKAEASLRHGLLTVKLPKKDKGAKKLKVRLE
ncbi:MAG: Hsp20/alpha crystallin family protein [Candidatus Sungbacteria bacterium]|uniref:Hsp20/alpha crystallin family protein n=1 Tax=Candidatus Sungiibacteriota bacterium TaxID=2750080 RepID=A0A933DUA6_9BACT|nr:Hsp20/alpha crystallin family protein [Candidatus Sungbacteria bacterium]